MGPGRYRHPPLPGVSGVTRPTAGRARDALLVARQAGVSGVVQRIVRLAYHRYAGLVDFPLRTEDVVDGAPVKADPRDLQERGSPLTIVWICAPPAPGSGGHTTMFRMIRALEAAGHRCLLLLHDRYDGDPARHRANVRQHWPDVRAQVLALGPRLPRADAYVATSWDSAHVLAKRPSGGQRFYFVQDFEPWFYPRGAEFALAEATYRFGLHGITAGPWLAELLQTDYGMPCDFFEFGADLDTYRVDNPDRRPGVVFYCKADAPRRGHQLGVMAMQRFAALRPDVPLHVFGAAPAALPFPAKQHGVLTPAALNDLYNQCAAGLALSFTNVSLLPWELLAAGVVPVVNDAPHLRQVLRAGGVNWCEATPDDIAAALCAAVDGSTPSPRDLGESVQGLTWEAAGAAVVRAVESRTYGP